MCRSVSEWEVLSDDEKLDSASSLEEVCLKQECGCHVRENSPPAAAEKNSNRTDIRTNKANSARQQCLCQDEFVTGVVSSILKQGVNLVITNTQQIMMCTYLLLNHVWLQLHLRCHWSCKEKDHNQDHRVEVLWMNVCMCLHASVFRRVL